MSKFKVVYKSTIDGDCYSVWTTANSEQQAIDDVKDDYWDVDEIIECYQISSN